MRTLKTCFLSIAAPAVAILALTSPIHAQSEAEKNVQEFSVDGIHVILDQTAANQIVAVVVGLEGGYGTIETENPLLAEFTAEVSAASGSEKYPKTKYREETSRLVTSIGASATPYLVTYTMSCVRPKLEESWKIFADVVAHPRFDDEEIAKSRQQFITAIDGRKSEPDGYAYFMMDSLWERGTHVGRVAQDADVNAITVDAMKSFHDKILTKQRMTIVAVGNISRADLTRKIHEAFAAIPSPEYIRKGFEPVNGTRRTDLAVDDRVVPTAYLVGRFLGPERSSSDYWPLSVGVKVLSDRLYEEIRTKRNLSYAPFAGTGGGNGEFYGTISVSTTLPDSTIHVISRELTKLRNDGITEKELRDSKAEYITRFYMGQQSNLAVATRLWRMYFETGDWHEAFGLVNHMDKVAVSDVSRSVKNYLHTLYWVAVGEQSKMTKDAFLYP